jgi:arabinoxylan arabinofuranohydrolase
MYSLRPGTEIINYLLPASARYGVIRDPQGTVYPNVYADQDLGTFNFFEASSIRKVGNKYITVFSGYSGPEYGVGSSNSTLRYAVADSPLGPLEKWGRVGRFARSGVKSRWFENCDSQWRPQHPR